MKFLTSFLRSCWDDSKKHDEVSRDSKGDEEIPSNQNPIERSKKATYHAMIGQLYNMSSYGLARF